MHIRFNAKECRSNISLKSLNTDIYDWMIKVVTKENFLKRTQRHLVQSTEHRVQSTECRVQSTAYIADCRVQSTDYRAQSTEH